MHLRQAEGTRPIESRLVDVLTPGGIQIEVLGRRHHHGVTGCGGIQAGLEAGPGEDGGLPGSPCHPCSISSHPSICFALAGQVLLAVAQQVPLQLAAILIPLLGHQLLAGGTVGPDAGGHFCPPHVNLTPLGRDRTPRPSRRPGSVGTGRGRVQHVVVEILHRGKRGGSASSTSSSGSTLMAA